MPKFAPDLEPTPTEKAFNFVVDHYKITTKLKTTTKLKNLFLRVF